MKSGLIFLVLTVILFSCKKDELTGGYAILQGKWRWIGSEEIRINKVNGDQSVTFIPATDYSNKFFIEIEQKGKLVLWLNESEDKKYRIQTINDNNSCSDFESCSFIALNLNFDSNKSFWAVMNEDTMRVTSNYTNIPLEAYQDQVARYVYVHIYERIN